MNSLYKKHIISVDDLSRQDIELILETAEKLKVNPQPELLKHKLVASCFFEASTRTRLSFEASVQRMGGSIIGFSSDESTSLSKKGETLSDTISVISTYVDAIIIRHSQEGAAHLATQFSGTIPVFNAGDGANQHPTQTLLDLFTIRETQGRLEDLHIAMVGDLKYGRTVHSLIQALVKFSNNHFLFISPDTLTIPKYIFDMLNEKKISWSLHTDIREIINEIDILYMTRIQKERFNFLESISSGIETHFMLRINDLKKVRKNMKVLHPLPRVDEIPVDIDRTPYAWYFQQASNGIFTRQALLALVLNSELVL